MAPAVAVNGRFLTQRVTGVQRFAIEITRALMARLPCEILAPGIARDEPGIAPRRLGPLSGHAWEQLVLPRHAAGRLLLNLGNTAPLALRRQIVVLHDATPFTMPQAYSRRFATAYRLLQRALVRRGVRIATVSGFARDQLARHLGLDPAAIAVLGEGADHLLRVAPAPGGVAAMGLARPYVLAVGSLAPHKNLAALGATAEMLAARGMELLLVGAPDPRVFAAAGGGMPAPARWIGRCDDAALRALYENAACFVMPSLSEGFGLPVVEAMACGCPVVAARAGALPETCGGAALLADPADPRDIAAAVASVLDDPARAGALRAAGRARAAAHSWDEAAGRLADLATGQASA